jgi:hypothetical protein
LLRVFVVGLLFSDNLAGIVGHLTSILDDESPEESEEFNLVYVIALRVHIVAEAGNHFAEVDEPEDDIF